MRNRAAVLLAITIGGICPSLPAAEENPLTPWKELINLRTDAAELQAARVQRRRSAVPVKIQRIEHARGPTVNFDEFSVTITKLPTSGPTTADELFRYVRLNLDQFMADDFATFKGYNAQENADWKAFDRAPPGSVMLFKIPLWNISESHAGYALQEGAAVMTSQSSARSWTFSTVTLGAFGPGQHPVSGNREFGLRDDPGSLGRIYTRGVDRAIGGALDPDEKTIFKGADALWNGFQRNVKTFIEKNGGEARINAPVIRRPPWDSPDVAKLLGKELVDLRVEAMLVERLKLRKAARLQTTRQEMKTWPEVLKKRAWVYLTSALELACADPGDFERRYRDEKLPGVHFTKADFEAFYAQDAARRESVLDVFKLRRSKPLNECQKYILRDMNKTERPVTVSWVVDESARFRKDNPTLLEQLAKAVISAAQAMDRFLEDSGGSSYEPADSSSYKNESRQTDSNGGNESGSKQTDNDDRSARGMSGRVGNINLTRTRPDFDRGPGSTLGR